MSTVTAVLSLTHEWLMKLDDNQEISCIFFDFKKAFDSIPHALLMGKLDLLHLPQFILSWLDSYLTKRQQRVVVHLSVLLWCLEYHKVLFWGRFCS